MRFGESLLYIKPMSFNFLAVLGFFILSSCSSRESKLPETAPVVRDQKENAAAPEEKARPETIVDTKRLVPLAFGGDGFPRIKKFYQSSSDKSPLEKIEVDFNGDGRVDFIQNMDPLGEWIQKELADLDGDGSFDASYQYEKKSKDSKPEMILQEFDTHYNGKTGVWKYYNQGKLVRRELDRRGLGKPDYWEYYEDHRLVRVEKDENGDGIPDSRPQFKSIVKPKGPNPVKN